MMFGGIGRGVCSVLKNRTEEKTRMMRRHERNMSWDCRSEEAGSIYNEELLTIQPWVFLGRLGAWMDDQGTR